MAGDPEDQIERIEQELSREREQYRKFDLKEKELLGRLAELEESIAEKRGVLEGLGARLERHRSELEHSRARLEELTGRLSEVRKRLGRRLAAYYKNSRRGYLRLLAAAGEPDDLRRKMYYLRVIMEEDRRLSQELNEARRRRREAVEAVEEKLGAVTRLEQEESEQLAALNKDLENKVLLLMKVHREKEFYETAVRELQAAAEELRKTISDLDRGSVGVEKLTSDFARYKGKLPAPLPGEVIRDPSGSGAASVKRGVFIKGEAGAEVKAVYDGRVEYAGWLKGYGLIVIINHGSRYFTVSAHLSEVRCRKGQLVEQGQVIGLAGETESLLGPGLYFELRRAGEPLEPLAWLKVH